MDSAEGTRSTIPPLESGVGGWESGLRRASIGLIFIIVMLGLVGTLGVKTTQATSTSGGLSLAVHYALVTRPGLATPFAVEVRTEDNSPLPPMITMRIASPYLGLFDENGITPEPESSYRTEEWTWWTFEVPRDAAGVEMSFDARLEPAVQWGQDASVAVEVEGRELVAVDFTTWVMP